MYQPHSRITTSLSPDHRRQGIDSLSQSENLRNRGVGSDDIRQAGRVTRGRDPPGQNCVYIPPGDHRNERYRLSTFSRFPENYVPIFDLARAGFYYTGFKDQAKCFSCGTNVQGWTADDSPFDSVWHEIDCPMAQGRELRNVESDSTHFGKIMKQLCAPAVRGGENTMHLKSPNPSGAVSSNTARNIAHVTHSIGNFGMNDNFPKLTMAQVPDQEHKAFLATLNLTRESDRRKTFTKWPSYPAPYLPRTLAKEGFFYLGNLDRAQCFSCSGVLRNWSPADNVTEQHRNHFPNCRFHSGRDPRNVEMSESERREADDAERQSLSSLLPSGDVSEPPDPSLAEQHHLQLFLPCDDPQNPHMRSLQSRIDSFRGWPATKTRATPQQLAKAGLYYLGEADKTKCFYCNGGLQNWDYNDEPWTEHAKWFPGCAFINQQKGTRFVQQLTDTHPNLNRPTIRNAISPKDIPLFQDSPSQGACGREDAQVPMVVAQAPMIVNGDARTQQPAADHTNGDTALLNALKQKEESMLCKKCKTRKADNVLLPCGHLVSCSVCAPTMKKCIHCQTNVSQFVKTYRA